MSGFFVCFCVCCFFFFVVFGGLFFSFLLLLHQVWKQGHGIVEHGCGAAQIKVCVCVCVSWSWSLVERVTLWHNIDEQGVMTHTKKKTNKKNTPPLFLCLAAWPASARLACTGVMPHLCREGGGGGGRRGG